MGVRMCAVYLVAVVLALSMTPRAQAQTSPGTVSVTGTVSYQQRSLLPENTVVTVRLVDVSRQDAAATVVAEQQIPAGGKSSPIPFSLSVDSAKITDTNSYAVQATISTYSQTTFRSTSSYLVLTQGRPSTADILVTPTSNQLPNTSGATAPLLIAVALLLVTFTVRLVRRSVRV